MNKLNIPQRPVEIPSNKLLQPWASRINEYLQSPFSSLQSKTAQLLLTRDIIEFPQSRENVCNTLSSS